MSLKHLRDVERKSKKQRRCWLCGENILVGDEYVERTGTDEGEIHTFHMHPECQRESSQWSQDDWECISQYEMKRPLKGPAK